MGGARLRTGAAAFLVVTTVAAGCGGGGSGPAQQSGTPLQRALDSVTAGPASRAAFAFTDLERMRGLGIVNPALGASAPVVDRWNRALFGLGQLGNSAAEGRTLGFNPWSAATAIDIGQPPHEAVLVDGLDTSGVGPAFTKLGAKRTDAGQGAVYALGKEGSIKTTGTLARLGLVSLADRVGVTTDAVAFSPFESDLGEVQGGGAASIGSDPRFEAVSSCLGDAISAVIITPDASFQLPAALIGIGITTPQAGADAPAREVLCAATGSSSVADSVAAAMRKGFAPGRIDPATGQRIGDFVSSATVDEPADGVARAAIVLTPRNPPGFLYAALQNATIAGYLGAAGPPDQRRPPPGRG